MNLRLHMRSLTAVLLLLAFTVNISALSADAKRPRRRAKASSSKIAIGKFGDPTKLPEDKAQNLVNASHLPAFYDPANLSRSPILSAKSAILMDAVSGEILWSKNPDVQCFPASTTKIMTGLLLAERTQPEDIITCTDPKIRQIEESSLHIQPWEKFTSKDLLYGTMLRSANDGSVVIAEHISGSVAKFADLMNERATEAGATNTHFHNPNGLPDPEHWTTAHDLAMITRVALENDRFRDAVKIRKRVIARSKSQDKTVASKAKKFYETFPGADGVKTGYTRAAKHCFVGSATRDGRQLIGVILGAQSSGVDEMIPLMGWGFRRFPMIVAVKKDASAPAVAVAGGTKTTLLTTAGADFKTFGDTTKAEPVIETIADVPSKLVAPIKVGQEVGRLVIKVDGEERGSVPLIAAEEIDQAPIAAVTRSSGGKIALWSVGIGAFFLIGLACYGTASAKNARRRRNRVPPSSRRINNVGPRDRERPDRYRPGYERRPGA